MSVERGKKGTHLATDDAGDPLCRPGPVRARRCRGAGRSRRALADDGQTGPSGLEHPCSVRGRRSRLFRHPSGRGGLRRSRRQTRARPFLDGPSDRRKGPHRRRRKRHAEKRDPARDGLRQMDGLHCPFRAGGRQRPEADPHDGREKGKSLCARWGKGVAHQWSPGRSLHCICRDG